MVKGVEAGINPTPTVLSDDCERCRGGIYPALFIQETRSRLLLGCPHRYGAEVSDAPGFRDDSWTDPDVLRNGIIPLYFDHDIGGPMARTVADAVAVFNVIAGHDPADPVTDRLTTPNTST